MPWHYSDSSDDRCIDVGTSGVVKRDDREGGRRKTKQDKRQEKNNFKNG